MCLALPVRVVELKDGDRAIIDLAGVRKEISLELVDGVAVGDFVILHVGYALTRLDPDEAERTLALLRAAGVDAAAPADAAGMDAGGGVHGDGDSGRGKEWR
jgi:hydrogenase expression/formation protein HypC